MKLEKLNELTPAQRGELLILLGTKTPITIELDKNDMTASVVIDPITKKALTTTVLTNTFEAVETELMSYNVRMFVKNSIDGTLKPTIRRFFDEGKARTFIEMIKKNSGSNGINAYLFRMKSRFIPKGTSEYKTMYQYCYSLSGSPNLFRLYQEYVAPQNMLPDMVDALYNFDGDTILSGAFSNASDSDLIGSHGEVLATKKAKPAIEVQ